MKAGAWELAGLRVLVVEDEMLNAMFLEDLLLDLGCEVVGPAATVAEGLALASSERPDAAVLDVNLGADRVYPVADALRQEGVPFVFVTGYGVAGLIEAHKEQPTIEKPINPNTFGDELAAGLQRARRSMQGTD